MKDKLRAEGFISIRDQPEQEREKIIFRERENWLLHNLFAGKRGNWLKNKSAAKFKLYALSSCQKS